MSTGEETFNPFEQDVGTLSATPCPLPSVSALRFVSRSLLSTNVSGSRQLLPMFPGRAWQLGT